MDIGLFILIAPILVYGLWITKKYEQSKNNHPTN